MNSHPNSKNNFQKVSPYKSLDAWRGVAAIWVVMVHACLATIANESPELAGSPLYAFSLWGQLGVTIFFVISGYCISAAAVSGLQRGQSHLDFVRARIRRIYPPYFASLVAVVLVSQFALFLASKHIISQVNNPVAFFGQSFIFYFAQLTLTQFPLKIEPLSVVYWSLCYEVAFYAVVLLLILLSKGSSRTFFQLLNTVTLASLVWLIVSPRTCPFPINMWPLFGFGALVYLLIIEPKVVWNKCILLICTGLMLYGTFLHPGKRELGHPSSGDNNITCVIFTILLILLYKLDAVIVRNRLVALLTWLGTFSYSLYLTHTIVLPVVNQLAKRAHMTGDKYWVSFALQVLLSIPVAYAFHLLFERPFMSNRAKARELVAIDNKPKAIGMN